MNKTKLEKWLYGLLAAGIGGFAGAVDSSLALMVIAPEKFNLGPNLKTTLWTALVLGALTGAKCAFAYLKQSPLPAPSTGNTDIIAKEEKP